jgi:hypothetical protein
MQRCARCQAACPWPPLAAPWHAPCTRAGAQARSFPAPLGRPWARPWPPPGHAPGRSLGTPPAAPGRSLGTPGKRNRYNGQARARLRPRSAPPPPLRPRSAPAPPPLLLLRPRHVIPDQEVPNVAAYVRQRFAQGRAWPGVRIVCGAPQLSLRRPSAAPPPPAAAPLLLPRTPPPPPPTGAPHASQGCVLAHRYVIQNLRVSTTILQQ